MRRPSVKATFILAWVVFACFSFCSRAQQAEGKRKIVSQVIPIYPELASKMRMTGTVKVEVIVAPNGRVKGTQVIGGSPVLAKAAVESIEKWRWVSSSLDTKELIELNFHP